MDITLNGMSLNESFANNPIWEWSGQIATLRDKVAVDVLLPDSIVMAY